MLEAPDSDGLFINIVCRYNPAVPESFPLLTLPIRLLSVFSVFLNGHNGKRRNET